MEFKPLSENQITNLCLLWNKELQSSFPMRERLLRQNIFQDPNFLSDGSWVAWDEEKNAAAGYIVTKAWQDYSAGMNIDNEKGWIHSLVVGSDYRHQGIGSELLDRAEGALIARGAKVISLGSDFHRRMFPGIPDDFTDVKMWFTKKGYTQTTISHDLTKSYEEGVVVDLPQFDNVMFRLAQPDELEKVISLLNRNFAGWAYQTRQYWELGGTGREFVLLEREGEIIGFCRINDSHSPIFAQNIYWEPLFHGELGGIGPLGVDERFRGLNYGLGIVQAGIHILMQRGIKHIVIDTTPFVDFYGKLGYKVWKSYALFEKRLD
jgi:ribosomal protein S18 acetylase RimI-like enzyme